MYGWRARIGLLIPSPNTTMEPEFNQVVPEGVSVHAERMIHI
jgi:maleate isomerase